MAVNLSPVAGAAAQFFDNSGNVLTGGKLYTYDAGTTTPAPTYTTSSGVTAQPNPIVLDAAGRVPDSGEIWLADGVSYKFVLKDTNDVLIGTYDNLIGINSNFVNFTGEEETQIATQGQTIFTLTTLNYQPVTNNLLVFVNGSKQISGENYIETSSTVITFVDGLNVGDVVDFCTATPINTAVVTASEVAYNQGGIGAVNRNVESRLQDYVSVKDFGAVGDGVTDDTDAIQTAIDYAITNLISLTIPSGKYAVSTLLIKDATYGMNLFSDGAILSYNDATPVDAVIEIVNCVDFDITGSLDIIVASDNCPSGLYIHAITGTAQACSRINIYNITVRYSQFGFTIGDYNVDYAVSEINIFGCNFLRCPTAIYLGGTQTLAQFHGCNIVSEDGSPYVTSTSYHAIYQEGGCVTVVGGSIVADYGPGQFIRFAPAESATYGNPYGILRISGAHIETNLQVLVTNNGRSLATPGSDTSNITINVAGGYISPPTTDDWIFIQDSTYEGALQITDCNFYAQATRAGYNISSASVKVKVQTDRTSWGKGFQNWMAGVYNGVLMHSVQPVLSAFGLGTQTIAVGTPAVLKFTNVVTTGDLGRYYARYSAGGGTFSVPDGGFTSLIVNASCQWTGGGSLDVQLRVNGTPVALATSYPSVGGSSGNAVISTTLYNLSASDIIDVYAYAYTSTATFNTVATNYLKIVGSTI